jgi:glycerophosphoryl diester phosphodiesterase
MSEGSAAERSSSSARAAKVEQRVEELRKRRAQLAAGERPSLESVNFARQRAEDALQRAREAHHAAAQRHEELAQVHERTANSYQQAAMHGDDGAPHTLQEKADRHWQAAHDSHLRFAQDEAKAQDPKKSSSTGSQP